MVDVDIRLEPLDKGQLNGDNGVGDISLNGDPPRNRNSATPLLANESDR